MMNKDHSAPTDSTYNWYANLNKPSWAPPSWLFGPAWAILYVLIAITFGSVIYGGIVGNIPWVIILPFILNLVFNFAFAPIQFRLKNNPLAAIDILLVLGTIIWAFIAIWPYEHWVVYVDIPYLLWVSFATVLQLTVTYMNRGRV
jgi:tryptophan-rich sensory protein